MDRFRQKVKKDKPLKHVDKGDTSNSFIEDVKSIRENMKIKEILRTVKMNSSMRVKAPRGSKIMSNKDFNDNEEVSNKVPICEPSENSEITCATNPDVIITADKLVEKPILEFHDMTSEINAQDQVNETSDHSKVEKAVLDVETGQLNEFTEPDEYTETSTDNSVPSTVSTPPDMNMLLNRQLSNRDRKLSLDHTLLTRREGLSQSELDLHSIGKSPLERKSSFFRKKMDSFFKNTTEIFKRQSQGGKSTVQRRGSMSLSLHSLNEKSTDYSSLLKNNQIQGSTRSLQTASTIGRSTSSLSTGHNATTDDCQPVDLGSQSLLSASQPLVGATSDSTTSLSEACQESLLNARAISMSSGLDSAHSTRRRKSSNRSNRVSWVASEGLAHYFRRMIQDEKSEEMSSCHSYADFTAIPEHELSAPVRERSRRLSYQRAVSGEEPARLDTSSRRRHLIPENSVANYELSNLLSEFTRTGVPPLQGFAITNIPDEALAFLLWAEKPENLVEYFDYKKLPASEEARQAVIRELVNTEAVHVRHLYSVVEVFMAAAHALQDAGKLLDIDTEKLFANIPDVLNASLLFWDAAIYPMLADAVENAGPFNTEFMSSGFCHFRELFAPYEKFVSEQTKALDYLRSLATNSDFQMYLTWCHAQKECNRLQLSDILVKPMQRLTKYALIIRRIIVHTDTEPERTSLLAMESFAKNYVLDLNRSIRQREELERLDALANSMEPYDVDFKDEDLDRYFKMFAHLNLKAPMVNCLPSHSRSIIFQGDVRFKDKDKEMEVRAFLLTDMLLICKKQSKGAEKPYKLIRPKYMVDKMICFPKANPRSPKDVISLAFVALDEVGSSYTAFTFTDTQKERDPNSNYNLKLWEYKVREARLTYDLGVWFAKNPSRDLSEIEPDTSSDYGATTSSRQPGTKQPSSDDVTMEREARERVAAMLHRSMGASTEYDFSQASLATDSFDAAGDGSGGARAHGHGLRHPMHRNSTGGSSSKSRLSSFHQSTSAASHDEPQAGPSTRNIYHAGSSVEHLIPPQNPDDAVTSITVNVVSESDGSETVVPQQTAPPLPEQRAGSRSLSTGNTLRVQPAGALALVHSLPDLTVEPSPQPPRPSPPHRQQSASEKLYQSHQELLQRNRLSAAHQHYLSPDHRGSSYPPPSPTRASLKRGLAFSYSFKNPPLSKMGHVNSQGQLDSGASTSQGKSQLDRPASPTPGTSTDKPEKKSRHFISRNKSGGKGSGGGGGSPRKDDKGD